MSNVNNVADCDPGGPERTWMPAPAFVQFLKIPIPKTRQSHILAVLDLFDILDLPAPPDCHHCFQITQGVISWTIRLLECHDLAHIGYTMTPLSWLVTNASVTRYPSL